MNAGVPVANALVAKDQMAADGFQDAVPAVAAADVK